MVPAFNNRLEFKSYINSFNPIVTGTNNRIFNMLKGLNIRIYPNVKQTRVIEQTFGCTRFVYNKVLGMKKELWEDYKLSFNPKNQILERRMAFFNKSFCTKHL